jgi:Endo-beta-mannanase
MSTNALLQLQSPFFLGVNYWASHAGTRMWSDWRPEIVERDFRLLADSGVEVLRVFPLWPDFQPIHRLYGGEGIDKGIRFGEQHVPDTEAGHAGMSELMMERFVQLVEIAERHNLKLIVGLITGWMSGRLFVPPALEGKSILRDPDAIRWQSRFVTYFIKHTRELDSIIAWDLGNECNVMGGSSQS